MTTKLHAATGDLMRLVAGPGEQHDVTRAAGLVENIKADPVIADKGCDADALHDKIKAQGAATVIPPRKNRKSPRSYDADLYKERNKVDRFFSKRKQFRRVPPPYDRLPANFMSFFELAAIAIWIRKVNRHCNPA